MVTLLAFLIVFTLGFEMLDCPSPVPRCTYGDESQFGFCTCERPDYCWWVWHPSVHEKCRLYQYNPYRFLKEKKPSGDASKCKDNPFLEDDEGVCNCVEATNEKGEKGFKCGWYLKCDPEKDESC